MNLKTYFYQRHYVRMQDMKEAGFHPRTIAEAVENGWLEKVSPGLYRRTDLIEHNL